MIFVILIPATLKHRREKQKNLLLNTFLTFYLVPDVIHPSGA